MTTTISFANQKGGVGKSTLCIQMAFFLANKQRKKVLVLDMDGQGNTSSRLAPRKKVSDFNYEPLLSGTKMSELFLDTLEKLDVLKCPRNIDLIHTPKNDPDLFEIESASLESTLNPQKHIASISALYDYILIDCPPSLGRKLIAALIMSTDVVSPIKLSGFAVDGVEGLLNTIIGIREAYNSKLNILGIVVNDMDRSVNHDNSLRALQESIPDLLFNNRIMHRPPLDAATTEGVPVWELKYGHVASKEVEAVLNEIMQKATQA